MTIETKKRVFNLSVKSADVLMMLYAIVLLAYVLHIDLTIGYNHVWQDNLELWTAVLIVFSAIVAFIRPVPGRRSEWCILGGIIFLCLFLGSESLLLMLISPSLFSFPDVTPYSGDMIAVTLFIVFIPIYILFLVSYVRKAGPLGFSYEEARYSATGKTVEEFHDVVFAVLNEYDDFVAVKRKIKGGRTLESTTSGWINSSKRQERVGITVTLLGRREKMAFQARIEIGCNNREELQRLISEISGKLGFSKDRLVSDGKRTSDSLNL